jgi:glycosyltransferase involved in cell wall biosynthesis
LIPFLATVLPQWRFEALACRPEEVAERLRTAAAFVHLSRYEGNSIVCLEAMAMNLPCIFTDVGLARDVAPGHVRLDVGLVDAKRAFRDPEYAALEVGRLLGAMRMHPPAPREFVQTSATPEIARAAWRRVLADFAARTDRTLDLGRDRSAVVKPSPRPVDARV